MGSAPYPLRAAACAALLLALAGCAGSSRGTGSAGSATITSRKPTSAAAAVTPTSVAPSRSTASPTPAGSTSTPASTRVVTVAATAVRITGGTAHGSCFTSSLADPGRAGAFRCVAGNSLLDPCLAVSAHALVCGAAPTGPWRRLTVTGLPSPAPAPPALAHAPWVVRLSSGVTCTSVGGGTADLVDGQPVLYRCGRGGELVGAVDTSTALWQARLLAPGNTRPVPATVVTAWR